MASLLQRVDGHIRDTRHLGRQPIRRWCQPLFITDSAALEKGVRKVCESLWLTSDRIATN